jgi:hypothetical protein
MDQHLHQLHLQAGRLCGPERTCGKKHAYATEAEAQRAADAHNRWSERRHDVEPYPCAFCDQWHIGRVMPVEELEALISSHATAEDTTPDAPLHAGTTPVDRARAWSDWCALPRPTVPPLSDEAISRESIYSPDDEAFPPKGM